ncbi:glycosyltransferase family A protein [Bacteriovorax sp. PP10]|uniref:Glycosyltransferase family A protein n=1 Tax=Bacteriovorax antarcticus TaxID=3088717 RepID=A0ABU5VYK7_9BACT|nr:glycosyltransferase family A protein [Bacteriovorax sp. PP10]MEA9357677.1 glycosyltransferase family A protein [Bacteriovorax sp. PP10]
MLVDVIIPTFNRAQVMTRAIDSVLAQTYKNFILHIVDDGSTDDTQAVLEKYKNHSQVKIHFQNNNGVSAARNLAAFASAGSWISFLDSDDEWMPNKLEIQMKYLNEHPDYNFLHSEELWIRNGVRVNPKVKHLKSNDNIFVRSLDFCIISPSTVILKRELFLKHQGFDKNFIVCEDYDLWLKVLLTENIAFISTPLIEKHGGHADQLSTKFVAMDYWRIKSLVNLFKSPLANESQKELIKNVILKKSELLLKSYIKYENQKSFDEIQSELASIDLTVLL